LKLGAYKLRLKHISRITLLVLILPLFINGCITLGSDDDSYGSLSEAMDKSSDDYEGERTVSSSSRKIKSEYSHKEKIDAIREEATTRKDDYWEHMDSKRVPVIISTKDPSLRLDNNQSVPADSTAPKKVDDDLFSNIKFDFARRDSLMIEKIKQEERESQYKVKVGKSGEENRILIPDPPERYDTSLTLHGSMGQLFNSKFEGYEEYGIGLRWFIFDKRTVNGCFSVGFTNVSRDRKIYNSVKKDVEIVNIEGSTSYFFGKEHTFANPFYELGFGYTYKFWNYKNPISVNGSHDPIKSDRLDGFTLSAGVGLLLFQPYKHNLELKVVPGAKLWVDKTREDFDNDLFKSFSFLKLELVYGLGL